MRRLIVCVVLATCASCSSANTGDGRGYLGGEAGVETCPVRPKTECPATPPSYAKDVAPILNGNCAGCHKAGGENPNPTRRLDSYNACNSNRTLWTTAQEQASTCVMPPAPLPPLPSDELVTLECWFDACLVAGRCPK